MNKEPFNRRDPLSLFEAVIEKSDKIHTAALNASLYTQWDDSELYNFLHMMLELPHMREEWGLVVGVAG